MPARALILGAVAVAAVGVAVYDQRENILEFADRSRQKIAELLRLIADQISSDEHRQPAEPMMGRPFNGPGLIRSANGPSADPRAAPALPPRRPTATTAATGRELGESGQLRQRGAEPLEKQSSTVLFDAAAHHGSPVEFNEKASYTAPVVAATVAAAGVAVAVAGGAVGVVATSAAPTLVAADDAASESGYETARPRQAQVAAAARDVASQSSRTVSDGAADNTAAPQNPFASPAEPFWSIHEWQAHTALADRSSSPSLAGSAADDDADRLSDVASDFGSEPSSVGSWTEVASQFSDDPLA